MANNGSDDNGSGLWVVGGVLLLLVSAIGSCAETPSGSSAPSASRPVNDYQDMRNRGHSEEDAVIFGILKQQGYSDYEAVRAMQSSKER